MKIKFTNKLKTHIRPFIVSYNKYIKQFIINDKRYIKNKVDSIYEKNYDFVLTERIDKPNIAALEINKNCNLNCIMCNTALSQRPQMNMDLLFFENQLKYMKSIGQVVTTLHTINEPLINTQIEEYFKLLRKYNLKILLSTNGITIDKQINLIIEYQDILDSLHFSIDGARKESYEKIRRPAKFDKLIKNLNILRNSGLNVKLLQNSILSLDTIDEIGYHFEFYSQWFEIDNINISLLNGVSLDNSYFIEMNIFKNHLKKPIPCECLNSNSLHILNSADVSICPRDYNGEIIIGNLNDIEHEKIFNTDEYNTILSKHLNNDVDDIKLCSGCILLNYQLQELFSIFVYKIKKDYIKNKNKDKIQQKFYEFIELFKENIPNQIDFQDFISWK